MEQIADAPLGVLLLWLIVLGLLALAVWQIAEAFLERNPDPKKKWGYRAKYLGTAVAYLGIAFTALVYALGGQSDSSQSSQSFSAQLMSTPGGIVLLVLFGLLIAGIGVAFVIRGITRAFKKHLDLPPDPAGSGIVAFGVVGYVAKGIAIGVTGVAVRGRRAHPRPGDRGRAGRRAAHPRRAPVRTDHPLDRRTRPDPLRTVLLRPRPLRQNVNQHRPRALRSHSRAIPAPTMTTPMKIRMMFVTASPCASSHSRARTSRGSMRAGAASVAMIGTATVDAPMTV